MSDENNDLDLLTGGLDGEYFGIAAYQAALGTGLLSAGTAEVAKKFQQDHTQHAERVREEIRRLGGTPGESKSWAEYAAKYPPPPLASETDVLRYAASLEESAAVASVASVAKYRSSELARLAASIAGVEAMHWGALLAALGDSPVPVSFIPDPEPAARIDVAS